MNPDATGFHRLNEAIRVCVRELLDRADPTAAVELDHLLRQTAAASFAANGPATINQAASGYLAPILAERGPWPTVTGALAQVWRDLDWHYHYAERADAPGLAGKIAFAELAGPKAPLVASGIRMGFTMMASRVLYPAHAHPAHELYVVLSGRALWTQSGRAAWRDPGAVIVHDSEEPHAMQTKAEPLLALYSWRGAIDAPARYV